jgi:hypothetical protein
MIREQLNKVIRFGLHLLPACKPFFLLAFIVCFLSPPQNLPYMNGVTKVDQNGLTADPEKATICKDEGLGPGLTETITPGTQVAKNEHYTIHVGSYNTSKRIQEATGYKMLTMSTYNL